MCRMAVFVDGSNLYGDLRAMNVRVDDYEGFFRHLARQAKAIWEQSWMGSAPPLQLRRVYWYVVGSMDTWDLEDAKARARLRDWYGDDAELQRKYSALARGGKKTPVDEQAWQICFEEARAWYAAKANSLEGMMRFYHSVKGSTDFIDIIEAGHWQMDLLHRRLQEKGLDTALAVDMVGLVDNYDVALLISGDADALPSLRYLKANDKQVGAVQFVEGEAPDRRGRTFSSRLGLAADFVVRAYERDLVSKGVAYKPEAG